MLAGLSLCQSQVSKDSVSRVVAEVNVKIM